MISSIKTELKTPLPTPAVTSIPLTKTVFYIVVDLTLIDKSTVPIVFTPGVVIITADLVRSIVSYRLIKIRRCSQDVIHRNRLNFVRRKSPNVRLVIWNPIILEIRKVQTLVICIGNPYRFPSRIFYRDTIAHQGPVRP